MNITEQGVLRLHATNMQLDSSLGPGENKMNKTKESVSSRKPTQTLGQSQVLFSLYPTIQPHEDELNVA